MSQVQKLDGIAFTVRGEGRPLFLVGAPAGLAGFARLAAEMAGDRMVVTHDPRGIGASSVGSDGKVDPANLADDVATLIGRLCDGPVDLFGSSGGAVTCLALLGSNPELVSTAILHEPPLFGLLPDAAELLPVADRAFATALVDPQEGLQQFSDLTGALHSVRPGEPAPPPVQLPPLPADELERQRFALGVMAPASVHYRVSRIPAGPARVIVAAGEESSGLPARRAAAALADLLGLPFTSAPGSHLAPTTRPVEFADWLRCVLGDGIC